MQDYLNIKANIFGKNQVYEVEYNGDTFLTDKSAIINTKYIKPELLHDWQYKYGNQIQSLDMDYWINQSFNDDNEISPNIISLYKEGIYQDKQFKVDVYRYGSDYYYLQNRYTIYPSNKFKSANYYYMKDKNLFTLSIHKLIFCAAAIKTYIPDKLKNNKPLHQTKLIELRLSRYEDILE